MPPRAVYACATMIVVGMASMPYGYYEILRVVVFFFCILYAYSIISAEEKGVADFILATAIFGIALVFNPFMPCYTSRENWQVIDLFSSFLLFSSVYVLSGARGPQ